MSEHKFRYLLPPGTNFQFVARFKIWMWISVVLTIGTIAVLLINKPLRGDYMNWTIDFKGGTEMMFSFKDRATGAYTKVDPGKVRETLEQNGEEGFEVSEISLEDEDPDTGAEIQIDGMTVKTVRFSALRAEDREAARDLFTKKFADRKISKANWSGDRFNVRSAQPITNAEVTALFATVPGAKLEVKQWTKKEADQYGHADEGTKEYNQWYAVWGLDRQYEKAFEAAFPTVDVTVIQSLGVGAKAGAKLRDDAIKSIIYALFLIMLYLAFRFDIRYAPGAAFATLHDAIMVIGVFALTWSEVSLTSVAGLLTVMGYSVNETVIGFDRIRENEAKLKDKRIERIIDISINERLVRTIMTSSTVFSTTLIMNIFGTGLVKTFAFAMNVGVVVATYSSIFLAAPIFLWITKKWYTGPPKASRRRAVAAAVAETP